MWVYLWERVNGEEKKGTREKKGESEYVWDMQTLPTLLCWSQGCLVLRFPLSYAGWKFSQDMEEPKALFLKRAWWFIPFAEVGKEGTGVWLFRACIKGEECKAVDVLMSLGNLRTNPWMLSSWRKELHWSPISPIYQFWRGNPKTACWGEPG